MFIGRQNELSRLESLYKSNSFEMAIIYGRRRVGKTTLINEFCKNKKTIFFSALESTSSENLAIFSKAIFSNVITTDITPEFKSFSEAFDFITDMAENERILLVIDEYPYLAHSDKSISSLLQNTIDRKFKTTKLFIILCGSSMSFMENQVLGYKSPIYGRRTAQFKILPFDYYDTAKWVPAYTDEEKAIVYGVTGGVPLYLEKIRDTTPLHENILENFFDRNAMLFEEPSNLLKQELREPQTYNALISAIASGSSKLSEISSKVQITSALCAQYLNNLISLGIVRKETPITEKSSRRTIYQIADNLFRFWYRFIPPNMAAVASGRIKKSYSQSVEPYLPDFMGLVFEQICKDYLLYHCTSLPVEVGEIGQWWGTDPFERQQVQIDIVLSDPSGKAALLGECKFRNEKVDTDTLDKLIKASALLSQFTEKHYCLFSKSGFSERLMKRAERENVMLIDIGRMYE